MEFVIDRQTISDLELYENQRGERSVFALYNHTRTNGGRSALDFFFRNPLADRSLLENRIEIIRFFETHTLSFKPVKEAFDFIEFYLTRRNPPIKFSISGSLFSSMKYHLKPVNEYYIIQRGTRHLVDAIHYFHSCLSEADLTGAPGYITDCMDKVTDFIRYIPQNAVRKSRKHQRTGPLQQGRLDLLFRGPGASKVREILDIIYEFDAFQSIVAAKEKYGFCLPGFESDGPYFLADSLFHPFLEDAVTNSVEFTPEQNICFLTGPNMAGKSTFLKSVSIAVYLAHTGFPVPAKHFRTSVFKGLITTINLPDNIYKGYSHYYNEVLRVKAVAKEISLHSDLFVVFDEIFRGTNVKDAYDASLAVISSFAMLRRGIFAISTHITEIAEKLRESPSVFYRYFEVTLKDGVPQYSYILREGTTDERIGMYILEKEKVIQTIEQAGTQGGRSGPAEIGAGNIETVKSIDHDGEQ